MGQVTTSWFSVLDIPLEHKNFSSIGFQDLGCIYRMPKYPEVKFTIQLPIQMFLSIKVLNIWVFVPVQVIGWVWPFSSGGLERGKQPSLNGRDFVCMCRSAKLDNLPLISCLLELKLEIRFASLLLNRAHPDPLLLKVGTALREHLAWLALSEFVG